MKTIIGKKSIKSSLIAVIILSLIFVTTLFVSMTTATASSVPAFVNYMTHTVTDYPSYPATSTSFTYSNVQQGNLLVVAVSLSSTGTATVSSSGETWSHDVHHVNSAGVTNSLDIWSLPNANSGNKTINISCTGPATSIRVVAAQFSGVASSNHVIGASGNSGYGGTANAGNVTTGVDNTLLIAAARTDSDLQGWSPGSGYHVYRHP